MEIETSVFVSELVLLMAASIGLDEEERRRLTRFIGGVGDKGQEQGMGQCATRYFLDPLLPCSRVGRVFLRRWA